MGEAELMGRYCGKCEEGSQMGRAHLARGAMRSAVRPDVLRMPKEISGIYCRRSGQLSGRARRLSPDTDQTWRRRR